MHIYISVRESKRPFKDLWMCPFSEMLAYIYHVLWDAYFCYPCALRWRLPFSTSSRRNGWNGLVVSLFTCPHVSAGHVGCESEPKMDVNMKSILSDCKNRRVRRLWWSRRQIWRLEISRRQSKHLRPSQGRSQRPMSNLGWYGRLRWSRNSWLVPRQTELLGMSVLSWFD